MAHNHTNFCTVIALTIAYTARTTSAIVTTIGTARPAFAASVKTQATSDAIASWPNNTTRLKQTASANKLMQVSSLWQPKRTNGPSAPWKKLRACTLVRLTKTALCHAFLPPFFLLVPSAATTDYTQRSFLLPPHTRPFSRHSPLLSHTTKEPALPPLCFFTTRRHPFALPSSLLHATTTPHLVTDHYPLNSIQHMTDLRILSWNCRGIDSTSAAKTLDWNSLTHNVDLVLLQETAFSSSRGRYRTFDPHTLFQELAPTAIGARVHAAYATPFCAIIILNSQINLLAPQHRASQRIVHACITFREQSIAIASIYAPAPHTERQLFFETFPSRVMDNNTPTILGGDWNDAPSTLDFLNIRDNRSHLWRYIEHKIGSAGFFDPLRVLQTDDRIYTRLQMNRDGGVSSASRIDFFLVNTSILHRCHSMETLPSHSSDHSAIFLSIANSANLAPAQEEGFISRWKLPQPMARYRPFSQQAHTFIEQTYSQVLHPPRGIQIAEAYTIWIERCRNFAKITGYQLRLPFLQAHHDLQTLRRRIGSWDVSDAASISDYLQLRKRADILERTLSLTGQLVRTPKVHPNAHVSDTPPSPADTYDFFSNLFRSRPIPPNVVLQRHALLTLSTSRLSDATHAALTPSFSVTEFNAALAKAKPSHSAAGISGLPHVFFTCNSNRVAEVMCRLANSIR